MSDEKIIDRIIEERGKNYGHPYDHFPTTQKMYEVWERRFLDGDYNSIGSCRREQFERCLKHGVYMIFDKLSRMAENPLHEDNLEDIKGYATTIQMCLERDKNSYEEQMHADIQGYTDEKSGKPKEIG